MPARQQMARQMPGNATKMIENRRYLSGIFDQMSPKSLKIAASVPGNEWNPSKSFKQSIF
jgi:hypothetical protein